MLKLVGAFLVIMAGGLSGLSVAGSYRRRPRELRSLRAALQMLETEISYSSTFLPEALRQVAARCEGTTSALFSEAAAELSAMSGLTAAEAWDRALRKYYPGTALKPGDLAVLQRFGAYLGNSDREDQIKHLHLVMEQIDRETIDAENESKKNVKLWSYLGFIGGLLIVILLY